MKLHQSPKSKVRGFVLIALILCASVGFAQNPNGLVEVEVPQDNLASYKQRRETHGIYFGANYEAFLPDSYVSPLDSLTYTEMFGSETIPMINLNFDYKWNIDLGAIALGLGAGWGDISDDRSGGKRKLEVTKYMASVKFTADMLMLEPYVAPYVGFSAYQMDVTITDKTTDPNPSSAKTTPLGYAYTVGLLLQLDWMDYDVAKQATFRTGLENTFIDVFMTQYTKAGGDTDPDMQTDLNWGAGVRLEF